MLFFFYFFIICLSLSCCKAQEIERQKFVLADKYSLLLGCVEALGFAVLYYYAKKSYCYGGSSQSEAIYSDSQINTNNNDIPNVMLCCSGRDTIPCPILAMGIWSNVNLKNSCFFALFPSNCTIANLINQDKAMKPIKVYNAPKHRQNTLHCRGVMLSREKLLLSRNYNKKNILYINDQLAYNYLEKLQTLSQDKIYRTELECITKDDQGNITAQCKLKFVDIDDQEYKLGADGSFEVPRCANR